MTLTYEALTAKLYKPDKIPSGFRTSSQWAAEWCKSETSTKRLLQRAQAAGLVIMEKFKIRRGDSVLAPVPHYKFKK